MELKEKYTTYLLDLCISVLKDIDPEEKSDDLSWSKLFELSKKHNVESITYIAVKKLKNQPDDELMKLWKAKYDRATIKDVKQRQELEAVSKLFASEQIRHLPLKGCVLKNLYPRSDYRFMADMDILIDESNAVKVRDLLVQRGYQVDSYGKGIHDTYLKNPIYNIEIHRELMTYSLKAAQKYFHQGFALANETDHLYRYELSMEDFYVYNIAHFYKHYDGSGSGIRSLLDICVLNRTYGADWNLDYIESVLKKLDLYEFHKQMQALANALYYKKELSQEQMEILLYISGSGTYGTQYNSVKNQLEQKGKKRYYFERIFPPYNKMLISFPVLKKMPCLLPIFWIFRIVRALFSPKRIKKAKMQMKTVKNIEAEKKKQVDEMK